ncbi:AAA family ATPase [Legionella gresilensis]|uniref:AAA family ATPase n=1 Tax=Legionella gresilensis TaxID=91823 RepID=UPI0010416338|nr:AAA family ATPase [Legionella gresilensis]
MRIAVSGSHSLGKSTFVQDFIDAHPNYQLETEPYRALRDNYNIKFGKDSTRFCNGIQFYYNLSRVKQYQNASCNVIFDRCPIDYIAYSLYTEKYKQTDLDMKFIESLIAPTREALKYIDLLIFISINDKHLVDIEDDGIRPIDVSYRAEVDNFFKQIYFEQKYQVMPVKKAPYFIELWGDRKERLEKVARILKQLNV